MDAALFTDRLMLRPVSEPPPDAEVYFSALILVVDDIETEPFVHLADEVYEYRAGQWYGGLSGAHLPRNARWYLPEAELCTVPQAILNHTATPAPALPRSILALFEERN